MRYLGEHEITLVPTKILHVTWGSYIGGWTLAHKFLRSDYYWPTLMNDSATFIKMWQIPETRQSNSCNKIDPTFSHVALAIIPRGVYILGPFLLAHFLLKSLIVEVVYFKKWIWIEFISKITGERVSHFHLY